MANILSKAGITTGLSIEPWHVSQSIDAFTGVEEYNLNLSGSLTISGSLYLEGLSDTPQLNILTYNPSNGRLFHTSSLGFNAPFYSYTASINSYTASINSYTASINSYTASINSHTASINSHTASINSYTSSMNTATGSFFKNGGNSFGSSPTLGTNDNFSLTFKTNNSNRATLNTSGQFILINTGSKTNPSFYLGTDTNTGFYSLSNNDKLGITSGGTSTVTIEPSAFIVGNENFISGERWGQPGSHVSGIITSTQGITHNLFFSTQWRRSISGSGGFWLTYTNDGTLTPSDNNKVVLFTSPSGSSTGSSSAGTSDPAAALLIDANYLNGPTNEPNVEVKHRLSIGTLWAGTGNAIYRDPSTGNIVTTSSDERLKTNITTLSGSLDKVKSLRGVSYNWTSENDPEFNIGSDATNTQIGLIAQEVETVIPELVIPNGIKDYKTVKYSEMVAVLVEAIKEQQLIIDDLTNRIIALETP